MRCCLILNAWLWPSLLGFSLGATAEEAAEVQGVPSAGALSHLCKPLLHEVDAKRQILSKNIDIDDVHLVQLGVSLNDSDTSANDSASEYKETNLEGSEKSRVEPCDRQLVRSEENEGGIESGDREISTKEEIESLLTNRRMLAKAAFRANQQRVYNFGVLPENDGGLVLRQLSTDLESIFGINSAATIAVLILLSLSAIFVLVAIALLLYYLARRNSFYLSEECQDSVASLFMTQISQSKTPIAKIITTNTGETAMDVPSDSTSSDSSSRSDHGTPGARGYFILPHNKAAQQKIVIDSDCAKIFGEAVTNQMLEIIHNISTHGMAVAFNEATGIQMTYFRDLKKTGRVTKTPVLDIGPPVYSSRFSSNESRNSGSLNKPVSQCSSQTQFRADGSSEEASTSGRRVSSVPPSTASRTSSIQKKLDRKQSLYFAQAAVCNKPIPTQEFSFLEVEVCRMTKGSQVAIGVTPKTYPLFRLPGTCTGSVAYDSSGLVTFRHNNSVWFEGRASFTAGDFIGLLIKRFGDSSTEFHFYRNGRLQSFVTAPLGWKHKYHVCVGASGRAILALNFGTQGVHYPPIVGARAGHFPFGELTPMSPRHLKSDRRQTAPVTVLPVTAFALQLPVSATTGVRTAAGGYSPMDTAGGVRVAGPRGVYYTGGPLIESAVKAKHWQSSPQSAESPTTSTVDGQSVVNSPVYQEHAVSPGTLKSGHKNAAALDALITEDRKKSASSRNEPTAPVVPVVPAAQQVPEELQRSESELSIKSADCSSVSMTPASKRP